MATLSARIDEGKKHNFEISFELKADPFWSKENHARLNESIKQIARID